jgi:hypothetical protein
MTDSPKQKAALEQIQKNIDQYGHHTYVVSGETEPRFAYTIGLSRRFGTELILAGAIFYMLDDVRRIINDIAAKLESQHPTGQAFEVASCGTFSLGNVDASWATALMLGALDFYQETNVPALQIIPDETHWTIDVPDLSKPWNPEKTPIWQWLHKPWTFSVPSTSTAVTNLAALRGERITEAVRWEEDGWEIFAGAGPDVPKEEARVVPLGTLLAADNSLTPILDLQLEQGLWRDATSEWHSWIKR